MKPWRLTQLQGKSLRTSVVDLEYADEIDLNERFTGVTDPIVKGEGFRYISTSKITIIFDFSPDCVEFITESGSHYRLERNDAQ